MENTSLLQGASDEQGLYEVIKDALTPSDATRLRGIFSTKLISAEDQIVAVRSMDIFGCLALLLNIELGDPVIDDGMRGVEGWFYLTPLYRHPWFAQTENCVYRGQVKGFYDVVGQNAEIYADVAAFNSAFLKYVEPVLVENWIEVVRDMVLSTVQAQHEPDYEASLIKENYLDYLLLQLKSCSERKVSIDKVLISGKDDSRYWAIQKLKEILDGSVKVEDVVDFLSLMSKERGGVCVAFGEGVLPVGVGDMVTDVNDPHNVTHSSPELAIKIPSGGLRIGEHVVAVEALGDFEVAILERLGIL